MNYSDIKKMVKQENLRMFTGSLSPEQVIVNYILNDEGSESEINKFIESQIKKGKVTNESIADVLESGSEKQSRTLHTFDSFDELHDFMSKNNCGKSWIDENNKLSVYQY